MKIIHFTVNGKPTEVAIDERESLADTLRKRLGLTSVKKGCEVGECGACTVLVDIDSSLPDGMGPGRASSPWEACWAQTGVEPVQKAFVEEAGQCGFCTGADHDSGGNCGHR